MDIKINANKSHSIRQKGVWLVLLIASVIFTGFFWSFGSADFMVKRSSLVIGQVSEGDFTISVNGTGILAADDVRWLATNVDAKVEKIHAKPGKFVKKGEIIVELVNPQLLQQLAETQWELEAQEADGIAKRVSQESNLLEKKAAMLNAQLDYDSSKLKLDAQAKLYAQKSGAISEIDFKKTELETIQHLKRWKILKEQYQKMEENNSAQLNAVNARINKMKKTLDRVQQQVESLQVVATMESVVQEVPLEIGQQLSVGSNVAKLARKDSLIAELQIAELQIRNVAIGQKVTIDTRNSKIEGTVSRIDPAVSNGNVQVDVAFNQVLPPDARPDLSIDGVIQIAQMKNALKVNRPIFAQSNSLGSVYKLSSDGDFAQRVQVKLGKGSINHVQVLEGLSIGDQIIISDPTSFDSYQKIRIN